jgi:polynucleotide 5'-kinase involved in rRNA processing
VSPEEALQLVLDKLEGCGIDYMITGSFASNMHGVPRTTYDADIVIEIETGSLDEFIRSLGNEFYASREAAREAVSSRSMFNVIHLESGFKIDFITRKARAFSKEEFSRREKGAFLGGSRWFTTPEDVILTKLEWSKLGESERQFVDAVNVAKVQKENRIDPTSKNGRRNLVFKSSCNAFSKSYPASEILSLMRQEVQL